MNERLGDRSCLGWIGCVIGLRRCRGATLAVSLLAASAMTCGQTVKQGDPNALEAHEFHSPMVIETIFAGNEPSLWMDLKSLAPGKTPKPLSGGKWFSTAEWYALGKFTCDGVSLREDRESSKNGTWAEPGLKMRVRRHGIEVVDVTIEVGLYNPKHNHDKAVTINFEVLKNDVSLAMASLTKEVEDKASSGNNGRVSFILSTDEFRSANKLRLTMTTRDY